MYDKYLRNIFAPKISRGSGPVMAATRAVQLLGSKIPQLMAVYQRLDVRNGPWSVGGAQSVCSSSQAVLYASSVVSRPIDGVTDTNTNDT
jgi:hypothetical protein